MPDDLDFPVGYIKGGNKVGIRVATDVQDVWSFVCSNESVSLWCQQVLLNERISVLLLLVYHLEKLPIFIQIVSIKYEISNHCLKWSDHRM